MRLPKKGEPAVYFVQHVNGTVRIGQSVALERRLQQLKFDGYRWPLAWVGGGRDVGAIIRRRLERWRIRGEQFSPSADVMEAAFAAKAGSLALLKWISSAKRGGCVPCELLGGKCAYHQEAA